MIAFNSAQNNSLATRYKPCNCCEVGGCKIDNNPLVIQYTTTLCIKVRNNSLITKDTVIRFLENVQQPVQQSMSQLSLVQNTKLFPCSNHVFCQSARCFNSRHSSHRQMFGSGGQQTPREKDPSLSKAGHHLQHGSMRFFPQKHL